VSKDSQFNDSYSLYWASITSEPGATASPPSLLTVQWVLEGLLGPEIPFFDSGLDIACGYGRLWPAMSEICAEVDGVEFETTTAQTAQILPYRQVVTSKFEDYVPGIQYDFLLCWAAFEVLDQSKALERMNGLLQTSGLAVISGKNSNYHQGDSEAAAAEEGAQAKSFVQFFTDSQVMADSLVDYGFSLERVMTFRNRGDVERRRMVGPLSDFPADEFYEFAILLKKIGPVDISKAGAQVWATRQSHTLKKSRGK